jgi:hypothetical protein
MYKIGRRNRVMMEEIGKQFQSLAVVTKPAAAFIKQQIIM